MTSRLSGRWLVAGIAAMAFTIAADFARAEDILKELEEAERKPPQASHGGHAAPKAAATQTAGHAHGGAAQRQSSNEASPGGHDTHATMRAFLGPYAAGREGSGTSWLPDTTPHTGIHHRFGDWDTMFHAMLNVVYDHQGGPRGGNKTFASGMVMGMAQRQLGEGTFGLRAMMSPEPFMGASGYPLLLATGETANGRDHLIDRQHPHDLFMELAAMYSHPIGKNSSIFIYAGLPGEPALGPAAFMHRTSGVDIPEAPITHHWLDSTHISFGVVTAGAVLDTLKLEASAFRGREPDQHRYDIEAPKLDSYSWRVTWNPVRELSMQVSWGHLQSPEGLEPDKNENRLTASATYTIPFGNGHLWSTTAAWGRKMLSTGTSLNGFVVESTAIFDRKYTVFARAERVQENELLHDVTPAPVFTVNKLTAGGIWDFYREGNTKLGIGGLVSAYGLPGDLRAEYGHPTSAMAFMRLKIE